MTTGIKEGTEVSIIKVELKWFSVLAEHRGKRSEFIKIKPDTTGKNLVDHLSSDFPMLNRYRNHIRLAVNKEYIDEDQKLNDGDEIAFITPVSGG